LLLGLEQERAIILQDSLPEIVATVIVIHCIRGRRRRHIRWGRWRRDASSSSLAAKWKRLPR